ncbi:cytidine deaminase [Nonlabens sp.]|uniref:cytidine deaminase n=1 Tax=Nonlabens sp. TaxID=1888209 RepID=UPI003F6A3556
MKKLELHTTLEVYDTIEELAAQDFSLMQLAIEARHRAYAPYSNFTVGCALLLANGEIITGNNQENAAYPSGLCAERVAIFAAGSQYPGVAVLKLAITASPKDNSFHKPVPPCGACRQSIAEYENNQENDIELFFMGAAGKVLKSDSLSDLLPLVFDKNYL